METIFSKVKRLDEKMDDVLAAADGRIDKLKTHTNDAVSNLLEEIDSLKQEVEKLTKYVSSIQMSKFQDKSEDKSLRIKCLEITEKKYGQPNVKEAEKLFDYIAKGKVTE